MPNMFSPSDFNNALAWNLMPQVRREAGAPGMKGFGYFGPLKRPDGGVSTELAGEMNGIHFPLLVPTLSVNEMTHLLTGAKPTPEIWQKAYKHALMRGQGGKDPFAGQFDQRISSPGFGN